MKDMKRMRDMKAIFMTVTLLALGEDLGFRFTENVKRNPRSSLQGATITGQVVDARTFKPLRGAVVSAARVPTEKPNALPAIGFRTGPDGKFVLRGVAPGIVNFVVSKAGYAPGPYASIRPAADGETIDNVVLTVPPGASLGGRVLDEEGQPVVGATVSVRSAASFTPGTRPPFGTTMPLVGGAAISDEDGRYWIGGLSPGDYVVMVGSIAEPPSIVSFGQPYAVNAIAPGRPPAGSTPAIALATGEERIDGDIVIRFKPRFTGARPLDGGSTTIDGRVVDAHGVPFAHAAILLRQADNRATTIVTAADASGRFQFQNIPGGSFSIGTAQPGTTPPGAFVDRTTVEITAESRLVSVVVTADRGGAISGTLTDEFGDPALAAVFAMTPARMTQLTQSGDPISLIRRPDGVMISGRAASTDARGRYRLTGLPPGEYVLNVMSRDPMQARTEIHFEDQRGRDLVVKPTPLFYPGVPNVSHASKIVVAEGSESSGFDMPIQPIVGTTIDVTVTANRPVNEILLYQVQLDDQLPMLQNSTKLAGTSTATLDATAGRHRLLASAEVASNADNVVRLWAVTDVETDPMFPAAVNLVLEPGANVTGRIVFEGKETNRQNAGAWLLPLAPMPMSISTIDGNAMLTVATGEFSLEGVLPGRYVIQAGGSNLDARWMLKAATIGGRDVLDVPIDLQPGEEITDARLTVTDQINELTGTVTDAAGKPDSDDWVVVFSTDKKHWWPGSRRTRLVRPDPKGLYRLRALPAGNYVVTTIRDAIGLRQDDLLARLPTLAGTGVRVTIAEGERKLQALRVK